ncbi:farnesyl pyrophosphate synthase-like isoform X2 [Pomacea canaliculata]|uniref:farnesyl pyrophosphate synthase-like isoform X2 n=1 Tax=Pomacea canaliculata TaxID=400727 RepID=UPI000D728C20|nr:farnesyl pyrophosphate synthase-like isoform X2 [Pomacea canaliculata]
MGKMGDVSRQSDSESELQQFDKLFPELVEDVLNSRAIKGAGTEQAVDWFRKVAEYNVPFGKKNRGISVVTSYRKLVKDPAAENIKRAQVLGWCVEWLQAFFLVADDIMDQSETRRGQACWYKKDDVGLVAINDSFFLESAIFQLLRKHIGDQSYYVNVLELFHETIMQTVAGQCLDMRTAPVGGKIDFTHFTLETYSAIVKWKTAFYSFYLPVALAMHMAGISDETSHNNVKPILLKMGHFFQVQDDYLDCFGTPEVTGKIGTDIEDNKCSWLVVQALHLATPEQRQVLEENYGRHDAENVSIIKSLYQELKIPKVYSDYEESSYQELMTLIAETQCPVPASVFTDFAQKIYKRQK